MAPPAQRHTRAINATTVAGASPPRSSRPVSRHKPHRLLRQPRRNTGCDVARSVPLRTVHSDNHRFTEDPSILLRTSTI
ncbi:hypothetical protein MRX96_022729 [Rhipicephalus microplus]